MISNDKKYNEAYVAGKVAAAKHFQDKTYQGKRSADRLPPGQHMIDERFPVLDLGIQPDFESDKWKLSVYGEVENPTVFGWQDFLKLPKSGLTADFHCVTRWSKYDVKWAGVRFVDLVSIVKPKSTAKFVIAESADGYTTNNMLADMNKENVLLAYELEGQPIPKEHGWPVRVIIPHLYAWKGAKFLNGLVFTPIDHPGFWETRGYNNHGDPWLEERYSGDL